MAGMIAMISAMKIRLSVTTAPGQALPCAGTIVDVLIQLGLVTILSTVLTALMNPILILVASFAQRRALCPAQVFLRTVQSYATASPRAQTSGMSFFPLVQLLWHNLTRLRLLSAAVRRPVSLRVMTDPCV